MNPLVHRWKGEVDIGNPSKQGHLLLGLLSRIFWSPLLFAAGLLFVMETSSFSAVDWAALPPALWLPKLETDEEYLNFLNGIQNRFPKIFEGASQYNVDLLTLLKDERKLTEFLIERHPGYAERFKDRRGLELTVVPKAPIQVAGTRIRPAAFFAWQSELNETLRSLDKRETVRDTIIHQMASHLALTHDKWEAEDAKREASQISTRVLKLFHQKFEDPHLGFKDFFMNQVNRVAEVPGKLDLIRDQIQKQLENLSVHAKDRSVLEEYLAQANQAIEAHARAIDLVMALPAQVSTVENQQAKLSQLYTVLRSKVPGFDTLTDANDFSQRSQKAISELTDDDLVAFSDPDYTLEHLDRLYHELSARAPEILEEPETSRFQRLGDKMHAGFRRFSDQTRRFVTEATEPIRLLEIPPSVGVLRGILGGDCASRYSFPYPNDPHERVFAVYGNQDVLPRGNVSTTLVDVITPSGEKKKGLYVVTIAGKDLTAGDAELILRGLEKEKATLGADHILLPEKKNINDLINFSAISGVYTDHISRSMAQDPRVHGKKGKEKALALASTLAQVRYQDPEIRTDIQKFQSIYNHAHYDHMDRNQFAVIDQISHTDLESKVLDVEIKNFELTPPASHPMNEVELLKFTIDQFAAKRYASVMSALHLLQFKYHVPPNTIAEIFNLMENGPSKEVQANHDDTGEQGEKEALREISSAMKAAPQIDAPLGAAEFEHKVRTALKSVGFREEDIAARASLFYQGRLKAPDAFSPANITQTAKCIAMDFKLNPLKPVISQSLLHAHASELATTSEYQSVLEKCYQELKSPDEMRGAMAAYRLLKFLRPPFKDYPFNDKDVQALRLLMPFIHNLPFDELIDFRLKIPPHVRQSELLELQSKFDSVIRNHVAASRDDVHGMDGGRVPLSLLEKWCALQSRRDLEHLGFIEELSEEILASVRKIDANSLTEGSPGPEIFQQIHDLGQVQKYLSATDKKMILDILSNLASAYLIRTVQNSSGSHDINAALFEGSNPGDLWTEIRASVLTQVMYQAGSERKSQYYFNAERFTQIILWAMEAERLGGIGSGELKVARDSAEQYLKDLILAEIHQPSKSVLTLTSFAPIFDRLGNFPWISENHMAFENALQEGLREKIQKANAMYDWAKPEEVTFDVKGLISLLGYLDGSDRPSQDPTRQLASQFLTAYIYGQFTDATSYLNVLVYLKSRNQDPPTRDMYHHMVGNLGMVVDRLKYLSEWVRLGDVLGKELDPHREKMKEKLKLLLSRATELDFQSMCKYGQRGVIDSLNSFAEELLPELKGILVYPSWEEKREFLNRYYPQDICNEEDVAHIVHELHKVEKGEAPIHLNFSQCLT